MADTIIVDIRDNRFPPVTVKPGTFVVWQNHDSQPHSVETLASQRDYFNAGAMLPGEASSPILFSKPGSFPYLCRFHTAMEGTVVVGKHGGHDEHPDHGGDHGGHHSLHHYHGFVTGGRSGERLYMTHTPVLADERHNYQVILRGRFADPRHARIYDELRASDYGDQVVQIFHGHMSMPDIGTGKIKCLPNASVSYWPGGTLTSIGPAQVQIPGLEDVPIELDEVLHFHQFDTDAPHPEALTYILYGDVDDVFIDHHVNGAPSFHSVSKLARIPEGWSGRGTRAFSVVGRAIRSLPPRTIKHTAIVDNAYHLFWLLPPGTLPRQAQDPLIVRGNSGPTHVHDIVFADGSQSRIDIGRFLHFDIRLLNYGVLIT